MSARPGGASRTSNPVLPRQCRPLPGRARLRADLFFKLHFFKFHQLFEEPAHRFVQALLEPVQRGSDPMCQTAGTVRRSSGITATPMISIIASGCHNAVVPIPAMAG